MNNQRTLLTAVILTDVVLVVSPGVFIEINEVVGEVGCSGTDRSTPVVVAVITKVT